jgi:uncharacterized membrane-anchored protein
MDLSTLGIAMGSAWLSGINLYATVLTLGLLQRFHLASLPGDLSYLAHTWILIIAGGLFAVQFIADKIPAVDSIWDVVHTFIRIPAGAIMAAAAFAHLDPGVRIAALLIGGGIALSSHSAKTATKLAANASPEPISNAVLGLAGDVVTVGGSVLMTSHPVFMAALVVVALIFSVLLIRWIFRMMRRLFRSQPKTSMA